jgi:hypothetical protein
MKMALPRAISRSQTNHDRELALQSRRLPDNLLLGDVRLPGQIYRPQGARNE